MNRIKLNKFIKTGVLDCGLVFEKKECKRIYDEIYNSRNFRKIFVSEKYFSFFKKLNNLLIKFFPKSYPALIELKKKYRKRSMHPDVGVKGLNLTDNLNLDFIEKNKSFKKIMTSICGNNYNILLKKVVVGVPNEWIPEWVEKRIKGSQDTNLASYIKKKYRDMTYFRGIDFHQDIKDEAKKKVKDFITVYVYLNDVNSKMAPLGVILNSHKYGVTKFPHKLRILKNKKIEYKNENGKSTDLKYTILLGKAGKLMLWTAYSLHGTQPQIDKNTRISLRYYIQMESENKKCLLNDLQKKIDGDLLGETRDDLDPLRRLIKKGNIINKLKFIN